MPQGSVLGPVLFLLHTADLVALVQGFGLPAHVFADDLQVYCHFLDGKEQVASVHNRLYYCNSVLYSLPWSRLQLLQSVLNSAARLIRVLKRFDHISPVLIELHWLPYPQRVKYKVCMLMFKCLKGFAPAYLVAFFTKGSAVSGRSALRSAIRGDLVVPRHRTDWGLRAFAVDGPNCWNELPVELRDLMVSPANFAKHLKTHLFRVGFFLIKPALLSLCNIL